MAVRYKFLRKAELEFEILIRGGKPVDKVEENRLILRNLLDVTPVADWTYNPDNRTNILNSLIRLKSDIGLIIAKDKEVNKVIFLENFNSMENRFRITSNIPEELSIIWEYVQKSWQECVEADKGPSTLPSTSEIRDSLIQVDVQQEKFNTNDIIMNMEENAVNNQSVTENSCNTVNKYDSVNISKLRLCYNGNTCVFEFLERVQELAYSRGISQEALLRGVPELLSDGALKWFRQNRETIRSWNDFLKKIQNKFEPEDYQFRLSKEIYVRTQGKNESVCDYFASMKELFRRLSRPMLEEQQLEILIRNVRPVYSNQFGLNELDTVAKLQIFCERLEQNRIRSKFFAETPIDFLSTIQRGHPSAEIDRNPRDSRESNNKNMINNNHYNSNNSDNHNKNRDKIYAVRSFGPGRRFNCRRCETADHTGFNCPRSDEIFCFNCRAPNQKIPTCSNCRSKSEQSRKPNINNTHSKNE